MILRTKTKFSFLLLIGAMMTITLISFISCSKDDDPKEMIVQVTNVALNVSNITMEEGSSQILTVVVSPSNASNKDVVWSSSNSSIISVDQTGKITAISAGDATVTVTSVDGGASVTCHVVVTKQKSGESVDISSITLSETTLTIVVGKTATLTATILPTNADQTSISWSSSNTAVAIVSAGVITAISPGTVDIICEADDDGGAIARCSITVTSTPPLSDGGEW